MRGEIALQKRNTFFLILLVVCITAFSFLPSLFNDFVDFDDPAYVTENREIQDISFRNLRKVFTSSYVGCYCPLPVLSCAVEYHLFKFNPFPYHLTNLLLHIIVTLMVFYFIYLI